jgi:chromosome segregation ATPase
MAQHSFDLTTQLEHLTRQRQADQEKIARLQQQLEVQAAQILKLEEDTQSKLNRPPQFDDERYVKILNEMRRELDALPRYDQPIALARVEVERLGKEVATFQGELEQLRKKAEQPGQALSYLEDQRREDARRLGEVQLELPKLRQQIEANVNKIQLVERHIPQFGQYQIALDEIRDDIRRYREYMDYQLAERERQLKKWMDIANTQEQGRTKFEEMVKKYEEHYQLNKRALDSLQDFRERLEREYHQSQELQRLAENRLRAEIEKWRVESEHLWKKQSVEWKPHVVDLERELETLEKRVGEVEKFNRVIAKQMDLVLQIIEEDIQTRTVAAHEWQRRFEEIVSNQG